ncbi:MAG: hypothetical protein LBI02_00190 [Opitutaceae bacterium]|jgi:hypothetical protein|nr:hypothetical protein [Opitutaceae bacterium]
MTLRRITSLLSVRAIAEAGTLPTGARAFRPASPARAIAEARALLRSVRERLGELSLPVAPLAIASLPNRTIEIPLPKDATVILEPSTLFP